jgi:hypothetical protein
MQRILLAALTAALAAAFPPVARAIPVQINLTDDGLPLIPPAVSYPMKEFDILKLSFTVTNPGVNGPITLGFVSVTGAAQGPDPSDTVVSFGQGGTCVSGAGCQPAVPARSRSVCRATRTTSPRMSTSARHW